MNNYLGNGFNGLNGTYLPQNYQSNANAQYGNFMGFSPQQNGSNTMFMFMTEDEFKAYVVNPNCKLYAVDKEKMKFCIKSTDSLGNVVIDKFTLSKDNGEEQKQIAPISAETLNGYITKDELSKIVDSLKGEINSKMEKFNKSIKDDINKSIKINDILQGGNGNG